jgi:hypothetical protein
VLEVEAGGLLEDAQAELGDQGQDVVEDVRLDTLVGGPGCVVGEGVDLQGVYWSSDLCSIIESCRGPALLDRRTRPNPPLTR